jgi:hypothetical protein
MKTSFFVIAFVLFGTAGIRAQLVNGAAPQEAAARAPTYTIGESGPHHRVWYEVRVVTNELGQLITRTNRAYEEIATGLNAWDSASHQWKESREEFEVTPDGFIASRGQHQLSLAANLNTLGAVQLTMPDRQRLVSQPMFLSFYDTASGASVLIAQVKDCAGQLVASNVVIFADAFDGIQGSIRYTYTKAGMEQDVILYENLNPAEWGLTNTETVTLDMFSEFIDAPIPQKRIQSIAANLPDETLDFAQMRIGAGQAFLSGQTESPVPVGKSWQAISGRTFLIESVPFTAAQPLLIRLPMNQRASRNPVSTRAQLIASLAPRSPSKTMAASHLSPANSHLPSPAFVLDYTTLNTTQTNAFFQNYATYYISGNVSLNGTNTTFEGGCVFKNASGVTLTVNTPVTWLGDFYRPVISVAKDDNKVGETIGGSTGNPGSSYYATAAFYFDATTANTNFILQHLRVANAQTAVAINGRSGHVLRHIQMLYSRNGMALTNADVSVQNALFYNVLTNFIGSSSTGRVEHLTSDNAFWLNSNIGTNLYLTNSLLVAVTNMGNYAILQNVNSNSTSSGVFQTVGAGAHYLAVDSTNRNAGTTNINSTLAADFGKLTTYPPLVYSNVTISVDTTFSPQAGRDADIPDLGYHYDPLDYVFGGVTANGNLTFTAGTAAGWFRSTAGWFHAGYGIHLGDSLTAAFNGQEDAPDYWVRTQTVQESMNGAWTGNYGPGGIVGWATTTGAASIVQATYLRSVFMASGPDGDNHFRGDSGFLFVYSRNSEYYAGSMGDYGGSQYHTNALFHRCGIWWNGTVSGGVFSFRNCTFEGASFAISRSSTSTITVRDTTFDGTTFPYTDGYASNTNYTDYDYNAFLQGAARTPAQGAHDVIVTNSFNWQFGALGNYYLPTNSLLIDKGSRTADLAGLYHFTTQTDQTKETTSTVDIGYHYVALDGNGKPDDYDSDGIPDYLEDANGNGVVDSGETDWQSASDPGLKVIITRPKNGSVLP